MWKDDSILIGSWRPGLLVPTSVLQVLEIVAISPILLVAWQEHVFTSCSLEHYLLACGLLFNSKNGFLAIYYPAEPWLSTIYTPLRYEIYAISLAKLSAPVTQYMVTVTRYTVHPASSVPGHGPTCEEKGSIQYRGCDPKAGRTVFGHRRRAQDHSQSHLRAAIRYPENDLPPSLRGGAWSAAPSPRAPSAFDCIRSRPRCAECPEKRVLRHVSRTRPSKTYAQNLESYQMEQCSRRKDYTSGRRSRSVRRGFLALTGTLSNSTGL